MDRVMDLDLDMEIASAHMNNKTLTEILNLAPIKPQENRRYIGASSIGGSCDRAIWYGYKCYPREPMDARRARTLMIGKRLEEIVLIWLVAAKIKFLLMDKLVDDNVECFQGRPDAYILMDGIEGLPSILEIKTAKDSSFRIFQKKGLYEWNRQYYAQLQSYMGMSGIHEAYLLALNKDTSELHDEKVHFDAEYYARLVEKASWIASLDEAPIRINNNPGFYMCRGCDFRKVCHDTR